MATKYDGEIASATVSRIVVPPLSASGSFTQPSSLDVEGIDNRNDFRVLHRARGARRSGTLNASNAAVRDDRAVLQLSRMIGRAVREAIITASWSVSATDRQSGSRTSE